MVTTFTVYDAFRFVFTGLCIVGGAGFVIGFLWSFVTFMRNNPDIGSQHTQDDWQAMWNSPQALEHKRRNGYH